MSSKKKLLEGDPLKILKPFLGHWDVPDDGDLILTIDELYEDEVKNEHGSEMKPIIYFKEDVKPMVLNKTNRDMITKLHGRRTKRNTWNGKKIALFAAQESRSKDGYALRIRDFIPKTDEYICVDCGLPITDHGDAKAKVIANRALSRFGEYLCYDCAILRKEASGEE